jgi:hypothetical protein
MFHRKLVGLIQWEHATLTALVLLVQLAPPLVEMDCPPLVAA